MPILRTILIPTNLPNLLLQPRLPEQLDKGIGRAIQTRDFFTVDLHLKVIHAEAETAGHQVLNGMDLDGPVADGGPSGTTVGIENIGDGGNHRRRPSQVGPNKGNSGVGRRRFKLDTNRLPRVKPDSLDADRAPDRSLIIDLRCFVQPFSRSPLNVVSNSQ